MRWSILRAPVAGRLQSAADGNAEEKTAGHLTPLDGRFKRHDGASCVRAISVRAPCKILCNTKREVPL